MEQLQVALIGAILLVVPPLTMLLVAKIRNMKADLDAAFKKIRIAEDELGIKTTQDAKTGVQNVSRTRSSGGAAASSQDPQGIGQGEGPPGAA